MMNGWGNMMGGWGTGYGGYGMMSRMGILMPLIFCIGIILLGIYLLRHRTSQVHTGTMGKQSGMDILRERYARGEIDSGEYQGRKSDLEGK
ncbi:MAG: SHOCT domain-containing protein [Desulfosporosinus sp.]|nr:SHOCT domain-containing protein [Desulfosporosinus sp.]